MTLHDQFHTTDIIHHNDDDIIQSMYLAVTASSTMVLNMVFNRAGELERDNHVNDHCSYLHLEHFLNVLLNFNVLI